MATPWEQVAAWTACLPGLAHARHQLFWQGVPARGKCMRVSLVVAVKDLLAGICESAQRHTPSCTHRQSPGVAKVSCCALHLQLPVIRDRQCCLQGLSLVSK